MGEVYEFQPDEESRTAEAEPTSRMESSKVVKILAALGGYAAFRKWLMGGTESFRAPLDERSLEAREQEVEQGLVKELNTILQNTQSSDLEPGSRARLAVIQQISPAIEKIQAKLDRVGNMKQAETNVGEIGILGMVLRHAMNKMRQDPSQRKITRRGFIASAAGGAYLASKVLKGESNLGFKSSQADRLKFMTWSATNLLADRVKPELWQRKIEKLPHFEEYWGVVMGLMAVSNKELEEHYGYKSFLEKFGAVHSVLDRDIAKK